MIEWHVSTDLLTQRPLCGDQYFLWWLFSSRPFAFRGLGSAVVRWTLGGSGKEINLTFEKAEAMKPKKRQKKEKKWSLLHSLSKHGDVRNIRNSTQAGWSLSIALRWNFQAIKYQLNWKQFKLLIQSLDIFITCVGLKRSQGSSLLDCRTLSSFCCSSAPSPISMSLPKTD